MTTFVSLAINVTVGCIVGGFIPDQLVCHRLIRKKAQCGLDCFRFKYVWLQFIQYSGVLYNFLWCKYGLVTFNRNLNWSWKIGQWLFVCVCVCRHKHASFVEIGMLYIIYYTTLYWLFSQLRVCTILNYVKTGLCDFWE